MDINYFNPTNRFSNNIKKYELYRPSYPKEIIEYFNKKIDLKNMIVADIGAGTGIFTKLLLENGNKVYSIEPNEKMRHTAIKLLSEYEEAEFIDSKAESILLDDNSVNIITVAQAFHWFNTKKALQEFYRIIRDNGYVILLWNDLSYNSNFRNEYESIFKEYSEEYNKINHKIHEEELNKIFYPNKIIKETFNFHQILNLNDFIGRFLSSSFSPHEKDGCYGDFVFSVKKLFNKYKEDEKVRIQYNSCVYYCKFKDKSNGVKER